MTNENTIKIGTTVNFRTKRNGVGKATVKDIVNAKAGKIVVLTFVNKAGDTVEFRKLLKHVWIVDENNTVKTNGEVTDEQDAPGSETNPIPVMTFESSNYYHKLRFIKQSMSADVDRWYNVYKNQLTLPEECFEHCVDCAETYWVENGVLNIPEKIQDKNGVWYIVTEIGRYTITYSEVTEIRIPASVTKIGANAFFSCDKLTTINIPNGVTEIGSGAFCFCSKLYEIDIPDSVTKIGNGAFKNCYSLYKINIPASVTEIGCEAFGSCNNLRKIIIPNSVTRIGNKAFYYCENLREVYISDGVTEIGSEAFACCENLHKVHIPGSMTKIEARAFHECKNLYVVHIPDNLAKLGNRAFDNRCEVIDDVHVQNADAQNIDVQYVTEDNSMTVTIKINDITKLGDKRTITVTL